MRAADLRGELLELLVRAWPIDETGDRYVVEADDDDGTEDEEPDAAVPVAALVIVEWQGADGARWMTRIGTLGNGEPAPLWTVGMLAYEGGNPEWDSS